MMTRGFGMGFFGRMPFGEGQENIFEKWDAMSDAEKLEVMNKRMEQFKECRDGIFSVEQIDKRCREWLDRSPEEKEAFMKEHEKMHKQFRMDGHPFGQHPFDGCR